MRIESAICTYYWNKSAALLLAQQILIAIRNRRMPALCLVRLAGRVSMSSLLTEGWTNDDSALQWIGRLSAPQLGIDAVG
jgi:hypothetical protein